jgi:hypothetical protein
MAAVYGGKGNRWWVGLNVGSDQRDVFGLSTFASPAGYESLPSGSAADDAKFAAAAVKDKGSPSPVTISVENVSWFNINGPYTTQAQANAAIPAIQKAHPAPGEISQAVDAATGQPQSSNSAAGLTAFLGELSDSGTWIRVAKVIIGGVLVIVGLAKLTGVGSEAATVATAAAKSVPGVGQAVNAAKSAGSAVKKKAGS